MKESTRERVSAAIERLGGDASQRAIPQEAGCSVKTINAFFKEQKENKRKIERETPKPQSKGMGDIVFFGIEGRKKKRDECDNFIDNPEGRILSEYPGWMHDGQIQDMKEGITSKEREIARGAVDKDQIDRMKAEVVRDKNKVEKILASKPNLRGGDKDKIYGITKNLANEIQDSLFTTSQMEMGTIRAEDEADRMVEKRISLNKLGIDPDMAKELNLHHENGKVSRTDAERAYRILSQSIGERGSSEDLRRDFVSARASRRQ